MGVNSLISKLQYIKPDIKYTVRNMRRRKDLPRKGKSQMDVSDGG